MFGFVSFTEFIGSVILTTVMVIAVRLVIEWLWPGQGMGRTRAQWKQDLVDYLAHKLPPLRECTNREKPPFEFYLPREVCDALQASNELHAVLKEIEQGEPGLVILYTRTHLYKVVFLGTTATTRRLSPLVTTTEI